jgi:hypothetical protein
LRRNATRLHQSIRHLSRFFLHAPIAAVPDCAPRRGIVFLRDPSGKRSAAIGAANGPFDAAHASSA